MVFWSDGFWYGFRNNVVKWWRQIILPVFHVDNDSTQTVAEQAKQHKKNWLEGNASEDNPQNVSKKEESQKSNVNTNLTTDNQDAMDVLNRIEREKEAKEQKEIEEGRKKAREQERINAILDANKVPVDSFIEEGKARGNTEKLTSEAANEVSSQSDNEDDAIKQEDLRRAQEIIDRLNHEAAEDEEKKEAELEAEIEAAKAVAREKFGA
jgi:hypothetical protein